MKNIIEFDKEESKIVHHCLKALSNDKSRIVLNYAYVKNDIMWATDGHRTHWLKTKDGEMVGFYEVITNKKTQMVLRRVNDIGVYPNMESFIPKKSVSTIKNSEDLDRTQSDIVYHLATRPHYEKGRVVLNSTYLKDILNHTTAKDIYFQEFYGDRIYFSDKKQGGIIMPLVEGSTR